jgi:cadaverine:lysine antiporter
VTAPAAQKIGLIGAIAIVAGNMMGSGIALLPSTLASLGSITLISWVLATIGALALAFIYARLGNRDPQPGGPIAYSGEVAPIFGYQAGLLYFHAGWVGNLAMALAGVDYLSVFFPSLTHPIPGGIATIGVIWIFTFINLLGASWMGKLVTIGVIGLLIPVILTGTVGWFAFDGDLFTQNWHVGKTSSPAAIMGGVVLCIWAFIGVESASVNAGLVKNPTRTIPMATMIGTGVAAVVYIASCTVISGMFPYEQVADSGAPFALALEHIFHSFASGATSGAAHTATVGSIGTWIKYAVAAVTAFACLISLSSWIMMIAQAGARASRDGTLPAVFNKTNAKGVPVKGMLLLGAFATGLMVVVIAISAISKGNSQDMFGTIASVTVLFTVIPYFYSALQMMRLGRMDHIKLHTSFLPLIVSLIAIVWCFVALAGTSRGVLVAAILIILGVLIFYVTKDRTELEKKMNALRVHKVEKLKQPESE